MTESRPSVSDAYALDGPGASRALYRDWAASYDDDFAAAKGYGYPAEVARLFLAAPAAGRLLDVGAGTGLVAEALRGRTTAPIDGLDISPEMLAVAEAKGLYDRRIVADLTRPLPLADRSYGAIVSAGTFTHGHVGPDAMGELLRVTIPGARFALGIAAAVFDANGFGTSLARHVATGAISPVAFHEVSIYGGATHDRAHETAFVALFRRL